MTDISAWIGRTEEVHDQLSRNLLMRIAATLGEKTPAHGEALPPLWQCHRNTRAFNRGARGNPDGDPGRRFCWRAPTSGSAFRANHCLCE